RVQRTAHKNGFRIQAPATRAPRVAHHPNLAASPSMVPGVAREDTRSAEPLQLPSIERPVGFILDQPDRYLGIPVSDARHAQARQLDVVAETGNVDSVNLHVATTGLQDCRTTGLRDHRTTRLQDSGTTGP